jgi:Leucine-rich repeat (LRR) protein
MSDEIALPLNVGLLPSGPQPPSRDEIIALAREAIEASREEIRRSGELGVTSELQQPGVTVDLGHKHIVHLPEEVVDIIKDEIERLALSHNRVSSFPPRLAECKRLRYLNVRYNSLKEVPRPVLQLTSLEILDLSRNRLRVIPEEIRNLRSLKVLAISKNRIEKLPMCLGTMSSLRMLKIDDNPLIFPPPEVYTIDPDGPEGNIPTNEREALVTGRVKRFLRSHSSANSNRQKLQIDSDGDSRYGKRHQSVVLY